MKKFKKLAALVVAVVTLAATSITTCAEDGTLYLGPLEPLIIILMLRVSTFLIVR